MTAASDPIVPDKFQASVPENRGSRIGITRSHSLRKHRLKTFGLSTAFIISFVTARFSSRTAKAV